MTDDPASLPLEAVPADPVAQWQTTRAPADLAKAVDHLHPKIAAHLHRYGLGSDPLADGHARVLAAKALSSYDPSSGASLDTWLDRNMQPLSRFKRLRSTAVKVPEKIQLDNYKLTQAALDFEEKHGREPELDELADHAGMPKARVHQVRTTFRKMSGEAAFEGNLPSNQQIDFMPEAMEAVWEDSDKIDRLILEMKAGYGGKYPPMPPKEVAARLGLSPVQLSRRSERIGAKLDDILEKLER